MTDHKHGEMSTEVHEKTFAGFVKWSAGVIVFSIGALLFAAMVNG